MNRFAVAAIAGLLLSSPTLAAAQTAPATSATAAENPALASIIADYDAWQLSLSPEQAGREGDQAAKSRLSNQSRGAELARLAPLNAFKRRLAAVETSTLSSNDALNRDFLAIIIDRSIEQIGLDGGRLAFNSEGGPGQSTSYLAAGTRITNRADADAWLARLGLLHTWYDEGLADARRGLETGFV